MSSSFPYPFPGYIPELSTQHDVAILIEQYQKADHIKHCAHLTIKAVSDGYSANQYIPDCASDSFQRTKSSSRQVNFLGCPSDCRFYQPAWIGQWKKRIKKQWWPFRSFIVGTAHWYASLSPATQAILAMAMLSIIGSPWRDAIVEIVKSILGK